MNYIATFDIGTTAVKGVLLDEQGTPVHWESKGIETIFQGDHKEQDPRDWYAAFQAISKGFFTKCGPDRILGIVMSGQMQDLILLDAEGNPTRNAILYSDGRAGRQAEKIAKLVGMETLVDSTGNQFEGSRPFAKLLWVKEEEPEVYQRTRRLLISSKDYVIAKLTGAYVSDVVSCSTAGLMDIRKKCWNTEWAKAVGLDNIALPKLLYAEEPAGAVLPQAARESGYAPGTPVYAGTGDAGATTLASGISGDGEFNINLGTSGWVACTSREVLRREGVSNLAAMPRDIYINVVPFFNAGNVHKWISATLTEDSKQNEKYRYVDTLLEQSTPGAGGVLFLPYLAGERFPVMDADIKGSFIDLTPAATKQDLARAALEGVAFSIRQGLESIGRAPRKISLIGGGAKTVAWCQILADMLGHTISVYQNAEFLPSVAIAAAVLIAQGRAPDYKVFTDSLQNPETCVLYQPDFAAKAVYDRMYGRYCSIYPAIKQIV